MTPDLLLILGLLAVTVVLFAIGRPRMDAVALIMMTLLPLTGVISMQEALAGFSDPNIILIAVLFVVGEGLVRTGVAQRLGDLLVRKAGKSEARLILFLMILVAAVGSLMSSTGVVAIFIPAVLRIARNTGIHPGRLMMPLSMAALISGKMTLIATAPNLVVHSQLVRAGHDGFHFFAFTPFGIPILLLSIGYMLFARRWLTSASPAGTSGQDRPRLSEWIEAYGLADREYRVRVGAESAWIGKRLEDLNLRAACGMHVLAIERQRRFSPELIEPTAHTVLSAGDILFLDRVRPQTDPEELCQSARLEQLPLTGAYFTDQAQAIGMAEIMIPADSGLVGETLLESRFRSRYDLSVIGLRRGKTPIESEILEEPLHLGDTLLVAGPWRAVHRLQTEFHEAILLNMPAEVEEVIALPSKAPYAIGTIVLMVVLMVTGIVPNVQAALIAGLLLGLFKCVDLTIAYQSIHWKTLVLIVGMLPFSLALENTGGVQLAADALLNSLGDAGPTAMLTALFALTAIFGLFVSNTATAVLMAPVALAVAAEMGVSPYPFAMSVALAASAAYMTPVSSPVNTLVVGPGNYGFFDFMRIGVPFTLIVGLFCIVMIPILMPF
jgi:di/tricarboxylate transporter